MAVGIISPLSRLATAPTAANPYGGKTAMFGAVGGRPKTTQEKVALGGMSLERDQFGADQANRAEDVAFERQKYSDTQNRQTALDALDQQRYADTRADSAAAFDLTRRKTEQDLAMREKDAQTRDEILKMARGDASGVVVPNPGTAAPAQLGILTGSPAGAPGAPGGGASNTLAQTQVQDRAAQRTQGLLSRLEGDMIDRGILGSNLHSNYAADVLSGQADDLLDADVEMAMQGQDRAWEVEDRNFDAGQRDLDRQERRRQSLLDLLAGMRY